MFLALERQVRDAVSAHIYERYGVDVPVVVEQPPQPEFGELALPIGFALAKALKRAPRKIVEEIISELDSIPGVAALEAAGAGYLNVRFNRGAYADALLRGAFSGPSPSDGKIIVEHTNVNPNKAAHIGHLRNAVLGDTLVRMLRALGSEVEVQNYIDNTGVQVADVAVGFHFMEKKSPADVQALIDDPAVRFDFYCWDLYARASKFYKADPSSQSWRSDALQAIEAGEGQLAEIAGLVSDAIVGLHLDTMQRLDVSYDLLPRESEILELKFWATAFELLKKRQVIYLESDGKNKGCWVMPAKLFQKGETPEQNDQAENAAADDAKIIVRSNGTVTYVGKDIAYQLWKFGLLANDFHYRLFRKNSNAKPLWISSAEPGADPAPPFGRASRVFNVIDVRQSYLQDVVRAGLAALGFTEQAENSIHFSYEMVALSPRCCAELGVELSEEDRRRPYVEVSGRRGLGVKADDLIDRLVGKALEEVVSRHADAGESVQREIATEIAVGALRYFMLRFTRTTVIAFDFQEALSFEGETGPYVQYAAVRARNILRKLEQQGESMPDFDAELSGEALERQLETTVFWQMLLGASRREWVIEKAVAAGEPAQLARYAFNVAQAFNNFYHQHHILSETNRERKVFLLWMTKFFLEELGGVLNTMGIPAPEIM